MASWMAWPWFCETLEISTPKPSVTNRNNSAPSPNVTGEPWNGTPNTAMPTASTMIKSTVATRKYGTILPSTTSLGLSGITASCSNVPDSRSRTTPRLVMIVPTNTSTTPQMPGIMMSDVLRLGLYRTVTCGGWSNASAIGLPWAAGRLLDSALARAARAALAANNWLPSTSTWGLVPPVTTATWAWPSLSWSAAHVRPCPACVSTTLNGALNNCSAAAACGPATATVIEWTSKLAA